MPRTDAILLLLYLVNINQPISRDTLAAEYNEMIHKISRSKRGEHEQFDGILARLTEDGSLLSKDGLYSITLLGQRKIAAGGLARSRDKNRLFLLKTLMYK